MIILKLITEETPAMFSVIWALIITQKKRIMFYVF